jgi:protein-disulfide isomerase
MLLFGTGVLVGMVLAGLYKVYRESPTLDDDSAKAQTLHQMQDAAMAYCEAVKGGFGSGTAWNAYLKARDRFLAAWREDGNKGESNG